MNEENAARRRSQQNVSKFFFKLFIREKFGKGKKENLIDLTFAMAPDISLMPEINFSSPARTFLSRVLLINV